MSITQQGSSHDREKKKHIGIIGGGFAGLTLANLLKDNPTYQCVVLEARSANDNLFSYYNGEVRLPCLTTRMRDRLKLDNNNNDIQLDERQAVSRAKILQELSRGVQQRDIRYQCQIENIFQEGSWSNNNVPEHNYFLMDSQGKKHGPFSVIIAADGVRSRFRTLPFVYSIGDARWVRDVFYDFGVTRIQRGADIAMQDALEFEQTLLAGDTKVLKKRFQPRHNLKYALMCLLALLISLLVQRGTLNSN